MIPSFCNLVHLGGKIRGDTQQRFTNTQKKTPTVHTVQYTCSASTKAVARWITKKMPKTESNDIDVESVLSGASDTLTRGL